MSALPIGLRAEEMRRAFDRRFAEPLPTRETAFVDLLCIRLCGDPYALQLSDVSGLVVGKRLTCWPCDRLAFLGVAGFRGSIAPVYDLRVLLGYPPGAAVRWLVMAAARPVALGIDGLDGCLRLPRACIAQPAPGEAGRPHVHQLVRTPAAVASTASALLRPLVDLASALAAVRQCAGQEGTPSSQERRS